MDHETFFQLFLKHHGEVRAFINSVVRNPHDREDVFQEVSLVLWREAHRFDRERSFGAWARGITVNKLLERLKQSKHLPMLLSAEAIQAVAAAYDRASEHGSDELEALRNCVERLPEKSRNLVRLRYELAMSFDQIAHEVKASTDAASRAMSRIRDRLSECVREWLNARRQAT